MKCCGAPDPGSRDGAVISAGPKSHDVRAFGKHWLIHAMGVAIHAVELEAEGSIPFGEIFDLNSRVLQSLAFETRVDGKVDRRIHSALIHAGQVTAGNAVEILDRGMTAACVDQVLQSARNGLVLAQKDADLIAAGVD